MLRKILIQIAALSLALCVFSADVFAQTRIRFRRGSTSATVSGTLAPGAVRTYVLGAASGQYLSATISSGNGRVKFSGGGTSESWNTTRGDNYISIENTGGRASSYTLTISIR